MFSSSQTFEPRVGTAQSVFCIIYLIITVISLCLAMYVAQTGEKPYLHYFMAVLFGLMALKSYIMAARIKKLLAHGVYYEASVDSCEGVRGITIIKGTCDVEGYGLIHIESRLVGERVADEINRFLKERKQKSLPALVVGATGKYPRGMFTVKCKSGHLIEETAMLKADLEKHVAKQQAEQAEFDAQIAEIAKKQETQKIEKDAQADAKETEAKEQADVSETKAEDTNQEANTNAQDSDIEAKEDNKDTQSYEEVAKEQKDSNSTIALDKATDKADK